MLTDKLKEVEPNTTCHMVVKKLTTYEVPFEKSLKKVFQSNRSGAGEDEVYTPTLRYYEKLLLLTDREAQKKNPNQIWTMERKMR
jgi:hypothetical protein